MEKPTEKKKASYLSYLGGFILSILLTLAAYYVTLVHVSSEHETISHPLLLTLILVFAFTQLVVQAITFLHIGEESGSRWKLGAFIATMGLILLVVIASIWIMYHLNYNMTPLQMDQYMQAEQGGF